MAHAGQELDGPNGMRLRFIGIHPQGLEMEAHYTSSAAPHDEHVRRTQVAPILLAMTMALADIEARSDCERLVRAFYTRALSDPVIGFIFTDIARLDLEAHVPRITSFWETILLGAQSYSGGAFRPHAVIHARVPLRRGHFERWLWLWGTTVDELFAGPRAELAKAHAARVAAAFHGRLETMSPAAADASELPWVSVPDAEAPFTVVHSAPRRSHPSTCG